MLNYMSVKEASVKWEITERQVQKLCVIGRIPGAVKISRIWLIPTESQKPMDRRYKATVSKITIEEIVEQYSTYIYNLAYRLSGKPELAEDIAQETLIKVWKHLDELKNQKAIKKWLHTICVNEFKMMLRKDMQKNITYVDNIEKLEKDGQLLVNNQENIIDEIQANEDVKKLRNGCFLAMSRKLSLNQRIAFSLIDMFGLSIKETSEILGITPKAVKGLLYRARMNLDSFFRGHCYFLNTENPCRCEAWIEFFQTRNEMQNSMQEKILDYKEKGYTFDLKVRQKVEFYYHQIPDQAPRNEWYQEIVSQFKNS